jgi:hypothetical protein
MAFTIKNFRHAILCEDIRKEDNGKLILIGVYLSKVVVPEFPINIFLAEYVELFSDDLGDHDIFFRFHIGKITKKNKPLVLSGIVNVVEPGSIAINLPKQGMTIESETEFYLDLSFDNKNWVNILKKPIELRKAPTSSPTAHVPQLSLSPSAAPRSSS